MPRGDSDSIGNLTQFNGPVDHAVINSGSGSTTVYVTPSPATSMRQEFIAALQSFRAEMERAEQEGLSSEAVARISSEVEAAENDARETSPSRSTIMSRLERARAILVSATQTATAAAAAGTAIHKLAPLLESVIASAQAVLR